MCQVGFVKGERCFRDICIEDNYTLQFDPANQDSDAYRYIWAGFYLSDVKEVDTDHQHVTIDLGLMLTWRDTRVYCRNQVVKVLDILNTNMLLIYNALKSRFYHPTHRKVRKCSAPLTSLTDLWRPMPLTYRLKNKKEGAVQILELNKEDEFNNVFAKTTSDITLSCPMDFRKFPFDQQQCTFEMILDEVLNGNMTIYTGVVMFTAQVVQEKFEPSEFSYEYKV